MQNSAINDPVFLEAVTAIDTGDLPALRLLLITHPDLVMKRLDYPGPGYFKDPYLLWFIADNPIRHEKLPGNIVAITQLLIDKVQEYAPETFQQQVDYTLGLVVTGRIPRECGVQIELMDILIDAGAVPGKGHGALAHGNLDAAQRLIERGGELTLAAAVCLDKQDDIQQLLKTATIDDRETALVAAAFYGKAEMVALLIGKGTDVNAYPDASGGFHYHATALHQAVSAVSLETLKVLVEAGASLNTKDLIYQGTPLDWAKYMQTASNDTTAKEKYAAIERYLLERGN